MKGTLGRIFKMCRHTAWLIPLLKKKSIKSKLRTEKFKVRSITWWYTQSQFWLFNNNIYGGLDVIVQQRARCTVVLYTLHTQRHLWHSLVVLSGGLHTDFKAKLFWNRCSHVFDAADLHCCSLQVSGITDKQLQAVASDSGPLMSPLWRDSSAICEMASLLPTVMSV